MKTCNLLIFSFLANIAIVVSLGIFIVGGVLIFAGYQPIRPHLLTLIFLIFLLYLIPEQYSNWLVEKLGIGDKNSLMNNSFTIFYRHAKHCLEIRRRAKRIRN